MPGIARRSFLILIAGAATLTVSAGFGTANAQTPPPGRRVALSGYDPVSYFTLGRPEKGNDALWFAYDGCRPYLRCTCCGERVTY